MRLRKSTWSSFSGVTPQKGGGGSSFALALSFERMVARRASSLASSKSGLSSFKIWSAVSIIPPSLFTSHGSELDQWYYASRPVPLRPGLSGFLDCTPRLQNKFATNAKELAFSELGRKAESDFPRNTLPKLSILESLVQ